VIADPDQHKKLVIISPNATCLFALEDPDLTRGLPPFLTAITGMDTLVHAVESFVNKNTYPMTQALALEAIRDAAWALPRAGKDAKAAVTATFDLVERVGVGSRLGKYGVDEGAIPLMAKDAIQSGNVAVNPRETTLADIEALYKAAL